MESWKDLAKQLMWEMNPQTNYHGTPYTFNKFDDSKFLTGEGFMAHGPGHYSADLFNTADTYNPHEGWKFYNNETKKYVPLQKATLKTPKSWLQSVITPEYVVDVNDIADWFVNYKKTWDPNSSYITPESIVNHETLKDMYVHPSKYEATFGKKGNTYTVNVPNENFMWKEGLPLESQSKYVQKSVANRKPIDYTKYLSKYPEYTAHVISKLNDSKLERLAKLFYEKSNYQNSFLNKKQLDLASKIINKLPINEQMNFLKYLNDGNTNTTQDMVRLYGDNVKGIRAVGHTDGPINITFSGENIKMANTPIQKFINRIPTQTLGKMASKLYNTPGVAPAVKFITNPYVDIGTTVGSMILDERNNYLEKQKSINKLRQMKDIDNQLRNKPMVLQGRVEYNR